MPQRRQPDPSHHGQRRTLGDGDAKLTVLYLKGSPYEMGFAHGKLCADEVRYLMTSVVPTMLTGLEKTPAEIDRIGKGYLRFLRRSYIEELQGLADGAGLSFAEVFRMHALPDVSEWHCTFFAATGPATRDGKPLQIRALDYETRAGIQKHPALLVYQPTGGIPFVNVSWLGHIGMVTGMNAAGIAMSEIGDDWDQAHDSFQGRPLNFVMRDAVQFSRTMAQAIRAVKDHPRTTSVLYCLTSAKENEIRALVTSHRHCRVYTPKNLPFPTRPGLVYISMSLGSDWNPKVGYCLLRDYGKLDVAAAQKLMREEKTGNLHAVVLRPYQGDLWVANATESTLAYDRPYHPFSLTRALSDPFFSASGPQHR